MQDEGRIIAKLLTRQQQDKLIEELDFR